MLFQRFLDDRSGSVLPLLGLAAVPVVGLIGASVDYSRAAAVQTAMQAAVDSTSLAMAKGAASQSADQLQSSAQTYFNAIFTRTDAPAPVVSVSYSTTGGSQVVITATSSVNTLFMGIMGFNQLPVVAASTSTWGNKRLRVALVLDNTGSMSSAGKLTALQGALTNAQNNGLLDQLKAAAISNGDVYVSIIPFVKDVNVGSGNYNANWIYWDDAAHTDNNSWDAQNGTCSDNSYNDRQSCLAPGNCSLAGYTSEASCLAATGYCNNPRYTSQNNCTNGGYCSNSSYTRQSNCTNNAGTWHTPAIWTASGPGVWTDSYTWTPANHNTWNGCVVDRGDSNAPNANNYDTNVVAPSNAIPATQYAAEQYSPCPQAVMGLNYNWTNMRTLVTNMSPGGNTNQGIGLQLGWMSLTGGGPFTMPAESANYTYQHVIILLTDGLNTEDRWYTSQASIDARQAMTCANVKASGVILYTIQVNTSGDPTSTLLQNCASDSSKFFLLTSSSQIVTTFRAIGTNLTKLRIAR